MKEIYISQIDDFVAVPAKNRFEHKEAKALDLIESNGQWYGDLLTAHKDLTRAGPSWLIACAIMGGNKLAEV